MQKRLTKNRLKIAAYILLFYTTAAYSLDVSKSKVLNSKTTVTVKSEKELIVKVEKEYLITTEDAKKYGYDSTYETDFIESINFDATLYDTSGKKIRSLKKDDIEISTVSYFSVHSEHKRKYHTLSYSTLPYIITQINEFKCKSLLFWPDWDPQESLDVDRAELNVILEAPIEFKHKLIGDIGEPEIFEYDNNRTHYRWIVENVQAFENEFHYAPETAFQIGVKFTPNTFDLQGYHGSTESWSEFGEWFHSLSTPQMQSSLEYPEIIQFVFESDIIKKIEGIYSYLQRNTRYVQITLGIEGWQPHHVDEIHRNKYGDCKDLSAYMISMLQKVGVTAYPALVMTRDDGWVDPDMPGNYFNHCIAVVPTEQDTFWLECTSDVTPYNNPPSSLEGVNVLFIKQGESKLIRTPLSIAADNESSLKAKAVLKINRNLHIDGTVTFSGNEAIAMRSRLGTGDKKKQKDWLAHRLSSEAGKTIIKSFEIENLPDLQKKLMVRFSAEIHYFARKVGSRIIFEPRLFHHIYFDGEQPKERTMALFNNYRYTDMDSIEFVLPTNYTIKKTAQTDSVQSKFGKFCYEWTKTSDGLTWNSEFISRAREVPLEDYEDYFKFMNKARKVSEKKFILTKN